jgi:phosphatidylserine/phosphatidylglycerophosphate/cardiolipin synthase-like enzyme
VESDPNVESDPVTWFLTASERGNPDTRLDSRHPGGRAWTTGNDVRPLIHGAVYFRALHQAVAAMGRGDLLMFTDWRGDPDERLDGPGTELALVLAAAAQRGVEVRGLLWRSHVTMGFGTLENRQLGEVIEAAGGQCLLDMRVRPFGSHHQKLVVLRHRDRPQDDVAFVGGIDLCHGRRDDAEHAGDPQALPMAVVYGPRPPWHDIQLAVRGPAVGDVETVFRERWEDPGALIRNPIQLLSAILHAERQTARPLPEQLPDPPECGDSAVQLLRTYPVRHPAFPFARRGERSVERGYVKALGRARSLVYVEDQYLWSAEVVSVFADALRREPQLRMIFVIPRFAEQDGRWSEPPNLMGREGPLRILSRAGGDRVAVYGLENAAGTPVYVHAKACVIDDQWACVGSDNTNRRSWTHDSELTAAFVDGAPLMSARRLRVSLAEEHLGDAAPGSTLDDPVEWFEAFRVAARGLDEWHEGGCIGPRPPGRLRTYRQPAVPLQTRVWAEALYRVFYDPDGRGRVERGRSAARRAGKVGPAARQPVAGPGNHEPSGPHPTERQAPRGMDAAIGVVHGSRHDQGATMTEPSNANRQTTAGSLDGVADTGEPTVPPETAALLAAAGAAALTTKLANRWTLAGTATLAAFLVGALLVRSWRGSFTRGV